MIARAERQAHLAAKAAAERAAAAPPDVPEPPGPPTASQRLAALRALRHRMNGPIVPRPTTLTKDSMIRWMEAIAEIGHAGDVEVAWVYTRDTALKKRLEGDYRRIKAKADQRHGVVVEEVRREREQELAAAEKRRRADRLSQEAVADEARVAAKRDELAKLAL